MVTIAAITDAAFSAAKDAAKFITKPSASHSAETLPTSNFRMVDDNTGSVVHADFDGSLVSGDNGSSALSETSGRSGTVLSAGTTLPTSSHSGIAGDDFSRSVVSSGDPTGNLLGVEFDPSEVGQSIGASGLNPDLDDEVTPLDSISNHGDFSGADEDSFLSSALGSGSTRSRGVSDRVGKSGGSSTFNFSDILSNSAGWFTGATVNGAFGLIGQSMQISAEESMLTSKISASEYMQQQLFGQQLAMQSNLFSQQSKLQGQAYLNQSAMSSQDAAQNLHNSESMFAYTKGTEETAFTSAGMPAWLAFDPQAAALYGPSQVLLNGKMAVPSAPNSSTFQPASAPIAAPAPAPAPATTVPT